MADYWTKRQKRLLESMEKDERKLNQRLEKVYKRHESEIQQEIAAYYAQYGRESVIEYRVLLQGLSEADRTMLYERAEAFMEKHPQYADLMPIRESIYRLNRLEGLQVSMWIHLADIGAIQEDELREHLARYATEAGNLAAEALSHGPGFLDVNSSVIKATLDSKWVDGQDFSERIWGNQRKLAGYLADDFAKGVARGESYDRLCKALLQRFEKVERRDAERLIYTEGTFVLNESQAQVFQQDFETYSISTVGDAKVCDDCARVAATSELKPFRFDERETGVNFPPFHPWCRCSHVPAVEDWDQWIEDFVYDRKNEPPIPRSEWPDTVRRMKSAEVVFTRSQLGKKIGKHAGDFGLDPKKPEDRAEFKRITDGIIDDAEVVNVGGWRGQDNPCVFYRLGEDIVIVDAQGKYVTTMKGGVSNKRYQSTIKRYRCEV